MVSMNFLEKYFVNHGHPRRVPREVLALLDKAGVSIAGSFLEIGAGLGYTSCAVFDRYHPARVVISDFDPGQVQGAREFVQKKYGSTPPEFEFHQESALGLSFEDASFDCVVATLVFHHVEANPWQFSKTPTAAREVQRVLKPGGVFIFWDINRLKRVDALFEQAGFEILLSAWRKRVYRKPGYMHSIN